MRLLDRYEEIVGHQEVERLRRLAERLAGKRIVHVNSTRNGGGVAEIGDVLLDPLRRETRAHTVGPFQGCTAIVPGRVGQLAVPVGALLLAGDALKR